MSLASTQIAPIPLLSGMPAPHYNYTPACDGELSSGELDSQWLEIRRALAAQLFKSNEAICHTTYCDAALYALKAAEIDIRFNSIRSAKKPLGLLDQLKETIICCTLWFLLKVTKGGTSVARLIWISVLTIPLYATALAFSTVSFHSRVCSAGAECIASWIMPATSLFLTFGFSDFTPHNDLETMCLTVGAMFGLVWYALLAAVVIRRVYR